MSPIRCLPIVLLGLPLQVLPAQAPTGRTDVPAAVAGMNFAVPRGMVWRDQPRTDTPTIWLRGDDYKASVDGDAFAFIPFLGADAPHNMPVTFTVRGASVGGAALDARAGAVTAVGERGVQVARGDFAEVYDAMPGGIEQSFVFAQLPQRGDLVVELGVQSELAGRADADGVLFACERGSVSYRKFVVRDAAGRERALPIDFAGERIRLAVPADFVAAAKLPLVLDPLLASTPVSNPPDIRAFPDVAWNEGVQEHMVVWQQPFSQTDWDVLGQRADASFNILGPVQFFEFTSTSWQKPRIACKPLDGMYLVVAEASNQLISPFWIAGRRYQRQGIVNTMLPTIDIERGSIPGHAVGDDFAPDVGGDAATFVTTRGFLVVFEHKVGPNNRDLYYRQVLVDGSLPSLGPNVLNNGPFDDFQPSISKSTGADPGRSYCVAWSQINQTPGSADIAVAILDPDGFVLRSSYLDTVANNDTAPRVSTGAAQLPQGRTFLITYQRDYDPFGGSGTLACAIYSLTNINRFNLSTIVGRAPTAMQYGPTCDSDGLRFAVAWSELVGSSTTSWVATLALNGNQLIVQEARTLLPGALEQCSITSRYSGGLAESRSYGIVDVGGGVRGHLYNGHASGTMWSTRGTSCGPLNLTFSGFPVLGHSIDLAINSTDPIRGFLVGTPVPLVALPFCTNCLMGVSGQTVPAPWHWPVPYVPALVGTTLSAQGWSFHAGGSCAGQLNLSQVVDFTIL